MVDIVQLAVQLTVSGCFFLFLLSTLTECDQDLVGQRWSPITGKVPPPKVVQDTPHKRAHEPSPLANTLMGH